MDVNRFLNEAEVVGMLGLKSKRTLRKWRAQKRGPAPTAIGGAIRYRTSDLEEWLESRKWLGRSGARIFGDDPAVASPEPEHKDEIVVG
jgi:predicted DNA-binding transcriptional regulator AlpA